MNINILEDPQFKEFVRAKDYKPKSVRNGEDHFMYRSHRHYTILTLS